MDRLFQTQLQVCWFTETRSILLQSRHNPALLYVMRPTLVIGHDCLSPRIIDEVIHLKGQARRYRDEIFTSRGFT